MDNCTKCNHGKDQHRDNICYEGFCTCIIFETSEKPPEPQKPKLRPRNTSADIWKGDGWNYKKKYGASQADMIKHYLIMGKTIDQIQELLHCKRSSIRGRKSELKQKGMVPQNA